MNLKFCSSKANALTLSSSPSSSPPPHPHLSPSPLLLTSLFYLLLLTFFLPSSPPPPYISPLPPPPSTPFSPPLSPASSLKPSYPRIKSRGWKPACYPLRAERRDLWHYSLLWETYAICLAAGVWGFLGQGVLWPVAGPSGSLSGFPSRPGDFPFQAHTWQRPTILVSGWSSHCPQHRPVTGTQCSLGKGKSDHVTTCSPPLIGPYCTWRRTKTPSQSSQPH